MNDLEQRVKELEDWKRQLESSSSIPLNIDQSFRGRFSVPKIFTRLIDFGSASTQSSVTVTTSITEARVGDLVVVTPPPQALVGNLGGIYVGYVPSTGKVAIRFINPDTSSSLDPGQGIFTIAIFKQ